MSSAGNSGIYKITNKINGNFYIGSSQNIAFRWRSHLYSFKLEKPKTRSIIHSAVRKYGVENFSFEVLEECEPLKDTLLAREQYYIDTLMPVYNLLQVAGSRLGSKMSEETLVKLRGKKHTSEWKKLMSIRATAFMNDPATKDIYRALRQGKPWSELFGEEKSKEIRAKMSVSRAKSPVACAGWNRGIPMAEGQQEKMLAAREGKPVWNLGIPMSEAAKEKLSISLKAAMTDEHRLASSIRNKGKPPPNKGVPMTPEQRQKNSEAHMGQNLGGTSWNAGLKTGRRTPQQCENIGNGRRGKGTGPRRPRTDEEKAKISLGQIGVPRFYSRGKPGPNNRSGHFGVAWRNDKDKWVVRIQNKKFGLFTSLEDALARRDEVLKTLV